MFKFLILTIICLSIRKSYCGYLDELSEEQRQMIKNLHGACIAETGVSTDLIAAANKGDFKPEEPLQCYMKCLLSSVGMMDEDGMPDFEVYVGMLPDSLKATGEKVVEKCKGEVGNNPCETAYKLNICTYNVDPSKYEL